MKVAVYHNLPTGGAKRAMYELIARTAKSINYDVYSIADNDSDSMFDINKLASNVFLYPTARLQSALPKSLQQHQKTISITKLQQQIASDIDVAQYDAVFVHSCKDTHSPGVLTYLKTPSLYYLQEPRRPGYDYNLMPQRAEESSVGFSKYKKIISRKLLYDKLKQLDIQAVRQADSLLCNSYFSMEAIARAYGKYATVCYLGIDNKKFYYANETLKDNYVISVGALHPNKGHHLAVQAISKLKNKPILHIVYDRSVKGYKQDIVETAQELNVELVLHHQISDKELRTLYRGAQATICTAELEPFGFTPLESNACGTPVVAIKEGGYRETVNDKNGILVNRSVDSLASGIETILNNTKKYSAKKLSQQAHEMWSWDQSVEKYMRALKQVIQNEKE